MEGMILPARQKPFVHLRSGGRQQRNEQKKRFHDSLHQQLTVKPHGQARGAES